MIGLIMLLSAIGTVALIALCAPFSALLPTPAPQPAFPNETGYVEETNAPSTEELLGPSILAFLEDYEPSSHDAQAVKDELRTEVVRSSIQLLRRHGKSEDEIRQAMERYFALSSEELDRLMAEPSVS